MKGTGGTVHSTPPTGNQNSLHDVGMGVHEFAYEAVLRHISRLTPTASIRYVRMHANEMRHTAHTASVCERQLEKLSSRPSLTLGLETQEMTDP
jgi:hypothetical protein